MLVVGGDVRHDLGRGARSPESVSERFRRGPGPLEMMTLGPPLRVWKRLVWVMGSWSPVGCQRWKEAGGDHRAIVEAADGLEQGRGDGGVHGPAVGAVCGDGGVSDVDSGEPGGLGGPGDGAVGRCQRGLVDAVLSDL